MESASWRTALDQCADPARARRVLERLTAAGPGGDTSSATPEQARVLAALVSGSGALGEWLVAHPEELGIVWEVESLRYPRRLQGLQREVEGWLKPLLDQKADSAALARLREFKQREMLRIAARDLARLAGVIAITREISDLADVCLEAVYRICRRQLAERLGEPYYRDPEGYWRRTGFCVLGLGKLGGQELNYSSDVDLMFVYTEEGQVFRKRPTRRENGGRGLSAHQYFTRLVEAMAAELTRLTPEGSLFRVDLRLRPEGESGPVARSLGSYETYYAQWGQTWERMMLLKARFVAGDQTLGAEFMEMTQTFRYPRSLGERFLREVSAMKRRIEAEVVKAGELDRNVKLGRGGIREIEFIAQALQLLHGGRLPFVQGGQTLSALAKLAEYGLLKVKDASRLDAAYCFFRDIEHRLQMENNRQTHTIPTDGEARRRLAKLMGFANAEPFERARATHARHVRRGYASLFASAEKEPAPLLEPGFSEASARTALEGYIFREPERTARLLWTLVNGPGYVHVSPRTAELGAQLIPKFLELCRRNAPVVRTGRAAVPAPPAIGAGAPECLSDPDRALARLDSFIAAYGARAPLYELWTVNPSLFKLLLLLFDRSEFLAEVAIRTPDLVDALETSGRLRRSHDREEILRDLRLGAGDPDQALWLRRYHQAELMRIGLRDILGLADFERNLVELSALADACVRYALETVSRRRRQRRAPFAIVGLGKLGGAELNYGSDLDLLFVAPSNAKNLAALQGMAVEVMDLLSRPTELGIVFLTDARLRPDGEKGLLVNTLAAFENYYRRRAHLWEIQALTRARAVAGDPRTGALFEGLAGDLTDLRSARADVIAYGRNWKAQVAEMRRRIEVSRTPAGKERLSIKTGAGGLMDAEFIAQAAAMQGGWREPNTLRALARAREERLLKRADGGRLVENYRWLRRVEGILRRWSFAGETVLPDEPAPLERVAIRCGFSMAESFLEAVDARRRTIREAFARFFHD